MIPLRRLRAELMLVVCALLWASSFAAAKWPLAGGHAAFWAILLWRFLFAALCTVLVFHRSIRLRGHWPEWRGAMWLGVLYHLGIWTQLQGLRTTTSGNTAFLSTLFVVFVPFLQAVYLRRRPGRPALIGVALATVGLIVLTQPWADRLVPGDGWSVLSALAWTVYIVELQRIAPRCALGRLLAGQFVVAAALAFAFAVRAGDVLSVETPGAWGALLHLGVVCTFLTVLLHGRYQPETTPTRAALIFTIEPGLAAVLGWMLLSETMNALQILGAAIILVAIAVAEVLPERRDEAPP